MNFYFFTICKLIASITQPTNQSTNPPPKVKPRVRKLYTE